MERQIIDELIEIFDGRSFLCREREVDSPNLPRILPFTIEWLDQHHEEGEKKKAGAKVNITLFSDSSRDETT